MLTHTEPCFVSHPPPHLTDLPCQKASAWITAAFPRYFPHLFNGFQPPVEFLGAAILSVYSYCFEGVHFHCVEEPHQTVVVLSFQEHPNLRYVLPRDTVIQSLTLERPFEVLFEFYRDFSTTFLDLTPTVPNQLDPIVTAWDTQ